MHTILTLYLAHRLQNKYPKDLYTIHQKLEQKYKNPPLNYNIRKRNVHKVQKPLFLNALTLQNMLKIQVVKITNCAII